MINEEALQDLLVSAYQKLKIQQTTIMNLGALTTALRDTLFEIGPRFSEAFEKRFADAQAKAYPYIQQAEIAYDEIIRSVNDPASRA